MKVKVGMGGLGAPDFCTGMARLFFFLSFLLPPAIAADTVDKQKYPLPRPCVADPWEKQIGRLNVKEAGTKVSVSMCVALQICLFFLFFLPHGGGKESHC